MADLSMKNINKIYPGGFQAVYDFSMDVKHGEFIVLVGPSGCGKSTMLRMIAGLETISSGDLILGGKRVNKIAPADRDIAMVFQNYALYGNMTVYENMGFSLTVRHTNGDEIHDKVMKTADVVELKNLLNRKPKNLSGGQRQRVALGRSIVRDASVFLMDEPLSNLDAKLRTQTRKELVMLHNRLNSTFIYVTHDQVEAMTMADRIVIMDKGVVQQIGTPSELYQCPNNVFVGGFIGSPSMNFIEGEIQGEYFISENIKLKLSKERVKKLSNYDKKKIILGVRPEAFFLSKENDGNILVGKVDLVEFLGAEYLVGFTLGDENGYKVKLDSSEVKEEIKDEIKLSIDMDKIHFFDIDTEIRVK
ncbi:ABC transporter ATP-binding protein [Clostridium sp. DL1XJH146]